MKLGVLAEFLIQNHRPARHARPLAAPPRQRNLAAFFDESVAPAPKGLRPSLPGTMIAIDAWHLVAIAIDAWHLVAAPCRRKAIVGNWLGEVYRRLA